MRCRMPLTMRSHPMRMVTARPTTDGRMIPRIPAMIMSTLRTIDQVVAEWTDLCAGLVIDVLLFDSRRRARGVRGWSTRGRNSWAHAAPFTLIDRRLRAPHHTPMDHHDRRAL